MKSMNLTLRMFRTVSPMNNYFLPHIFPVPQCRKSQWIVWMDSDGSMSSYFQCIVYAITNVTNVLKDIGSSHLYISLTKVIKETFGWIDCGISGDVCTSHSNSIIVVFDSEIYQFVFDHMLNLFLDLIENFYQFDAKDSNAFYFENNQ